MIAQKATAWAAMYSNVPRECPFPVRRVVISERAATWRKSVKDRLDHVCRLPVGWDGYMARAVDFGSANFALAILEAVCGEDTPSPSVVPGVSGDLQIEWHSDVWDIEVHVLGPYKVEAWRQRAGGADEALSLTNDFTDVRKWVGELSESAIAPTAAAA